MDFMDRGKTMTAAATAFYVVLAEGRTQGPIALETEMKHASLESAHASIREANPMWIRLCIVRCEFESGNELLFDAMRAGAERHQAIRDAEKDGVVF